MKIIFNRRKFRGLIQVLLLFTFHFSLLTLLSSCSKEKISLSFTELHSGITDDLNDVLFLNDSVGYICGGLRYEQGDILKTSDGGFTWQNQSTNEMIKALYHVTFISSDTGFTCGYDGKIFRTFDGGNSWEYFQNYYSPIRSLFMLNSGEGFACGGVGFDHGYKLQTTNYGDAWRWDTSKVEYRDIVFFNTSSGVMCGYGEILFTNDGGATWNYSNAKQDFFVAMSFVNSETGYAIGYTGSIWRTDDGGENWTRLRNSNTLFQTNWYLNCVAFRDENTGYVAGEKGLFLKTTDGGNHWGKVDNAPDVNWKGISLVSNGGVICGTDGKIYRFLD
ncbi:MAG: YCF48-related protein [Chitinophagales bacterium]